MHVPRLMIAGTGSGVGKTTITLGIMAALRKQGCRVAPFKAGPDYIDPGFHSLATGNPSRNLDLWLLTEETLLYLLQKNSAGMDLAIVEGVMGLYDGRGTDATLSSAHLAKVLRTPVVLVLDGSGMAASAAAMVLGYQQYDPEVNLSGVILNQVGSEGHYHLLREAIERDTGIRCYGYLRARDQLHLKSRHLGLVPSIESGDWQDHFSELAQEIENSIDLQGLVALAKTAPELQSPPVLTEVEQVKVALQRERESAEDFKHNGFAMSPGEGTEAVCCRKAIGFSKATRVSRNTSDISREAGSSQRLSDFSQEESGTSLHNLPGVPQGAIPFLRIGVAYDEAFHFYYQDNLDLLQELGAEVVRFSPLHDRGLPEELDGLYIGGGFPEVYAAELEANESMRLELASAIGHGIPTYAECGGMMYLTEAIVTAEERSYQMVGVIPARSVMTSKLQRFGYVEVEQGENLFGVAGTRVPAHEFHYSTLVGVEKIEYSYQIRKKQAQWQCGVRGLALLAGYPHFHFYSNPWMAYGFLRKCWEYHLMMGR